MFQKQGCDRKVLVHYHLFKNAGSSVDRILRKSFKQKWKAFDSSKASNVLSSKELGDFLELNQDVKAVSSHQARPPLPFDYCYPIVFLRHPIDRIRSVYEFVKRDSSQPNHLIAVEQGFPGYIKWALENNLGGRKVIKNFQVMYLSNASFKPDKPVREHLEQAKKVLVDWQIFGIVRRFNDSLSLFKHHYKDYFPEVDWSPIKVNVTNHSYTSDSEEVIKVRELLGNELYKDILAENLLDMELYDFALGRFNVLLKEMTHMISRN